MPFVRRHRALGCIRDLPWQRSSRRERLRARVDSPPRRDEPPSRRLSPSTFAVCWPHVSNWTLEPRIFRLGHVHWDPPARPRQCQHAGGATVGCQALHSPCTTLPRPREMDSSTRTRPGGPGSSSSRLPVSLRSHYYMMAQNQSGGRQRHRQDEAYDLQKVTRPTHLHPYPERTASCASVVLHDFLRPSPLCAQQPARPSHPRRLAP